MFAVIKSGGKQYKVSKNDVIRIELLKNSVGDKVVFDALSLFSDEKGLQLGQPVLDNVKVHGEVVKFVSSKKIIVFKKKRRKGYQRCKGHRQEHMLVNITDIEC